MVITELEKYFSQFRKNIVGLDQTFESPFGIKKIVYADWIASGRLYAPIEKIMLEKYGPFVGNTHSDSNETGSAMTEAYLDAKKTIKKHVNAGEDDVLIFAGYGMTAAVNKFQRILGLRIPEQIQKYVNIPMESKPVVFITHMEHHSNQTSWLETICDLVIIEPDQNGLVSADHLDKILAKYKALLVVSKIKSATYGPMASTCSLPWNEPYRVAPE